MDSEYYSTAEGLSHRNVSAITQDSSGYIWLATDYGLNRFDGYEFKWYTKEKNGLQSNRINHLLTDDKGLMWLFFTNSHLLHTPYSIDIFDPATEEVVSFQQKFGDSPPFDLSQITGFINSEAGEIIFTTGIDELVTFSHQEGFQCLKLLIQNFKPVQITARKTIWGYQLGGSYLLREALVEIDQRGNVLKRLEHDHPFRYAYMAKGLGINGGHWYVQKYAQERWNNFENGDLYYISQEGEESLVSLENTALPPNAINLKVETGANQYQLWLRPNASELFLYDKEGFRVFDPMSGWHYEFGDLHQELGEEVNTLFFDQLGLVWVGTPFGLFKLSIRQSQFHKIGSEEERSNQLAIRGITEDSQGNIWAGVDQGDAWVLMFTETNNGDSTSILSRDGPNWGRGYRYGMYTDSQGQVWSASAGATFFTKFDSNKGHYRNIPFELPSHVLNPLAVWSFFEDNINSHIWFGTNKGMVGYIDKFDQVHLLAQQSDILTKGGCIYQFLERSEGKIWLTTDNGIYELDLNTKEINKLQVNSPKAFAHIWENPIYHIYETPNGFWLGTSGNGLIFWSPDTGQFNQFTKADGLADNTIYAVYPDNHNHLWLSSNYGLIQFDLTSFQSIAFLEKDGTTHNEFNRGSHYQRPNGDLLFGGLNGITSFTPSDFIHDSLAISSPMVVTQFEQFDGQQNQLIDLSKQFSQQPRIVLSPTDRFFRLEFALLSYENNSNIQYGYKIEGVDTDWNYQKENSLRLSRLPFGDHQLRIKGQNANGQWSTHELSIPIKVLKPIYLKNWFILSGLLLLVSSIFIWYKRRVANYARRQLALTKLVDERTRELQEDKEIIEQQAHELQSLEKLKSKFFANVSHELRTPLTLMLGPIKFLQKRQQENHQTTELLGFAARNGQHLQKLIDEILDLSKLESGKLELREEQLDLIAFLQKQLAQFHSAAMSESRIFQFNYPESESIIVCIDKNKFEKILHNYFSNALKYAPPYSTILLNLSEEDQILTISIADSGQGIHPDDQPYVFDRFYQSKQPSAPTQGGTGIGLSLCKELAELMGGQVWVESQLHKGSTFYYRFPKGSKVESISTVPAPEQSAAVDISPTTIQNHPAVIPNNDSRLAKILLVEDNDDLRQFLQILLAGYQVKAVENGQLALEFLESQSSHSTEVDIIISDLMMPVMDGFELLNRLKADKRWAHLPVLMLTAKVNAQAKLKALRVGVDDYLTKPFQEEELMARVNSLLHNYRLRLDFFQRVTAPEVQKEEQEVGQPNKRTTPTQLPLVDAKWLMDVEERISEKLASPGLKIDEILLEIHLSERQFRRKLKRLTGLSPKQYLREARLLKGRELLEVGNFATIKETAYAVGFKDSRYFSQQFQERFGLLPSSYLN